MEFGRFNAVFYSDEDNGNDGATVLHNDIADDDLSSMSDSQHDAISAATSSSTLLASGSDSSLSRDAASSTNHVTRSSNSRRDVSFVSGADGDVTGPPWLPASGDALLQSHRLPSLQHGASGLLTSSS